MARKTSTSKPAKSSPTRKVSPVRNSAVPKAAPAAKAKPVLTHEMIALRAHCIAHSGSGGSDFDNWIRAEAELRRELGL